MRALGIFRELQNSPNRESDDALILKAVMDQLSILKTECVLMTPDSADLFRARRSTTEQSFDLPEPLSDLNTTNDERDPWLSPGGEWLYYSSNRAGMHAIYRARRATP